MDFYNPQKLASLIPFNYNTPKQDNDAKKAAKEESPAKTETKKSGMTKPMKLPSDLAAVVGQKQASPAECIKQLWAYLKKNYLPDPENKQYFRPDKKMAKIFGTENIRGFGTTKFLTSHLSESKRIKCKSIIFYPSPILSYSFFCQ